MLNLHGVTSLYTDRELLDRATELELSADEQIVVAQLLHLDVEYVRGWIRAQRRMKT